MALDCCFCDHTEECPYAYHGDLDTIDCHIKYVRVAKRLVDDDFKALYAKLKNKANDISSVSKMITIMEEIMWYCNADLEDLPWEV